MSQIFLSKNYANTETHSFANIYAIRIFCKGNNHSLPALLQLALVPYKHLFPLASSTECVTWKTLEILIYQQIFSYAKYKISAN